jgi:hypothetical protein
MRGDCGQASVEWTGLLLAIALVLAVAGHLASKADGSALGTTLAHSLTHPGGPGAAHSRPAPGTPQPDSGRPPLPRLARADALRALRVAAPGPLRAAGRDVLRRAGRGAGAIWRRAWFACLVYERTKYAFRHPESRLPGYSLPYGDALGMINNCVSPVDLLRDVPVLDPGLDPGS